jgi:hypothetical protein
MEGSTTQTVTLDPHREHITFTPFPTRRRVHQHDVDGVADQSVAGITIDIDDVAVAWSAASRRSGGAPRLRSPPAGSGR